MKKTGIIVLSAICAFLFASCSKIDYTSFVGSWGVEKIEYYNIDYAGHPISSTIETYTYDPNSFDNGIHLVFNGDKTGYMRDSAIDTIYDNYNEATQQYETVIYCPDTVLMTAFSCSYDKGDKSLYMTMESSPRPYKIKVEELTQTTFVYSNEYMNNVVEKAYLTRVDGVPSRSSSGQKPAKHPHHKLGTLFGNR